MVAEMSDQPTIETANEFDINRVTGEAVGDEWRAELKAQLLAENRPLVISFKECYPPDELPRYMRSTISSRCWRSDFESPFRKLRKIYRITPP